MAGTRIVITGASRGIGEALARAYAGAQVSLVLMGRDGRRLEEVAAGCRAAGAEVETVAVDICDRSAMAEALGRIDEARPIELLIANAGIQMPTRPEPGAIWAARDEIETNLLGALNTVEPVATRMVARGSGQIALMSSLAAYAALPDSPGYSASKAGLLIYGLSLRERLRPAGVKVSVICPGYVDGGMGDRFRGWKLIVVPLDRTAARIRRGLEANRPVIAFPWPLTWITRLTPFLPEWLGRLVLASSRFTVDAQPGRSNVTEEGDRNG